MKPMAAAQFVLTIATGERYPRFLAVGMETQRTYRFLSRTFNMTIGRLALLMTR